MDHGRRRRGGRHGRGHHFRRSEDESPLVIHNSIHPARCRPWSFLSGLYSFFILSSLLAIIYIMLEYHCITCSAKFDMTNISQNIDDIAKNLSAIKASYHVLEMKLSKFSQELPKIEGQVDILEVFANAFEGRAERNTKSINNLPNVDVYVNRMEHGKNISRKIAKTDEIFKA